jgi:hypothetical protein
LTPPPPIRRPPGRPGCTLPEPVPVVPLCRPGHEEQRTQQPAWRRAGRARRSPSAVQPRRRWEQPEQRPLAGKWRYHFPSGRNRSTLCAGTTNSRHATLYKRNFSRSRLCRACSSYSARCACQVEAAQGTTKPWRPAWRSGAQRRWSGRLVAVCLHQVREAFLGGSPRRRSSGWPSTMTV